MWRTIRSTLVISVLLISLVPGESKSSLIKTFRKLSSVEPSNQISPSQSPSQSPSPSIGLDFAAKLVAILTVERCNSSSTMSCRDSNNMTACLWNGITGPEGSYLLVQNDNDTSVNVNLTILPSNITLKEIELQKNQAKKINISELTVGSQSVVLNAENGNCTVHIASPAPEYNSEKNFPAPEYNSVKNFQWGGANVNPTRGAYILILMFLIGGGAWTCFELRKRGRHLDGVPYQELEMGQPEIVLAANVETKGGWDEDWDDDWDGEKAVKSPGGKRLRQGKANGKGVASGSSHDDGWGK